MGATTTDVIYKTMTKENDGADLVEPYEKFQI